MIQATFVMEQHIGHRSYYENLRRYVDKSTLIRSEWVEVTYESTWGQNDAFRFLPKKLRGSLEGREQVRRGLKRANSDISFFNTQVPAALSGRFISKTPYVLSTDITPRQYDRVGEFYDHQPDGANLLSYFKHLTNQRLFQGAARILPWSSWAADSLRSEYNVAPPKIEVLPPGVDINLWKPVFGAVNQTMRILFIGGDFHRKGGDDLIQAFQSLPAGRAELVLVTRTRIEVGDGIEVYRELTPNSAELVALCQSCDVFVLPTKAEAFGIAAVEASALGLPVLATNVGGLRDIVVDGVTGYLIQPGDIDALVQRLQLLIDVPGLRERYGVAARERAISRFDARKNSSRIIEILDEVLQERNAA